MKVYAMTHFKARDLVWELATQGYTHLKIIGDEDTGYRVKQKNRYVKIESNNIFKITFR